MKSLFRISIFLLVCSLVITACRKDEELVVSKKQVVTPEIIVNASVRGLVINQNGDAIEGASVLVNGENIITDENGVFSFQNIRMDEYGTLIKVEKDGFFLGAKFVQPKQGKESITKIMLLPRTLTASFNAADGATVTTTDGASIVFPANSVALAAGGSYDGTVNVYAKWLNPEGDNLLLEMPGDLRARNSADEVVQLATFGMVGVELVGDNGQALQMAPNQLATIEMPIPSGLLSNAPATIPLWHFDETTGYWVEEGSATLQGNKYIGEVSHFSFWNCDAPFPLIELSGTIIGEGDGGGIPGLCVEIVVPGLNTVGYGFTDENGNFFGKVPQNELLTLNVKDDCGNVIYTEDIGPFSDDTNIAILGVIPTSSYITVTGTMENCDGNPVMNGYVKVSFGGTYSVLPLDDNGAFLLDLSVCSATSISLVGLDIEGGFESNETTYDITGLSTLDVGTITACDVVAQEYFYYDFDGIVTTMVEVYGQMMADSSGTGNDDIFISGTIPNSNIGFPTIRIVDPVIGVQNPDYILLFTEEVNNVSVTATCQPCTDLTVTLTAFGEIGEIIEGTFSGNAEINGVVGPVSGAFKAIRDN